MVAESKNRVAAIFLFPVWSLAPLRRWFLPYSGPYGRRIADSRLEMLPRRKSGARSRNLQTRSGILKPEVLSKVLEIVGNVMKLTIFRKNREKCRRGQTGSSCVLWPTFDLNTSWGR